MRARASGKGSSFVPGDPLDRFSLDVSSASDRGGAASGGYLAATARTGERADSARRRAVAWIDVTMGSRVRLGEVRVDARGLDSSEPRMPGAACPAPNAARAGQRPGHRRSWPTPGRVSTPSGSSTRSASRSTASGARRRVTA
jgi:hypothetical protein